MQDCGVRLSQQCRAYSIEVVSNIVLPDYRLLLAMQPLSFLGNYCHVRMAECYTHWLSLTLCMPTPAVCLYTAYRVSCQAWSLLEESRVSDHANLQEHEHSIYKAIAFCI